MLKYSTRFFLFSFVVVLAVSSCADKSIIKSEYPGLVRVSQMYPDSGLVGTLVYIEGQDFPDYSPNNPTDSVLFNGVVAQVIEYSATHRLVRVPKGAATGPVSMVKGGIITKVAEFKVIMPEVFTYAGTGTAGFVNGPLLSAQFNKPYDLGYGLTGEVLIADLQNHSIRNVDPKQQILTYAGTGAAGFTNNKTLLTTTFNSPASIASDYNLNRLYIADAGNHAIRVIFNNFPYTFAGTGTSGYADAQGQQAAFSTPLDIVVDSKSNVFVADMANHVIRKIDPLGNVTTFAGKRRELTIPGFKDGKGTLAEFFLPSGLCIDNQDNLYVTDFLNNAIRKITPQADVTTIAGFSGFAGNNDGFYSEASFNGPIDLDIDALGNIYVADSKNHVIRILDIDGQVKTYAGAGTAGFQDGTAASALFNNPTAVLVLNGKEMLVSDNGNNRIRYIAITP